MNNLKHLIDTRRAAAAVIGLGYVGLPLSMAIHEAGFPVIGFDVDPGKIRKLKKCESYIKHMSAGIARVTPVNPVNPVWREINGDHEIL